MYFVLFPAWIYVFWLCIGLAPLVPVAWCWWCQLGGGAAAAAASATDSSSTSSLPSGGGRLRLLAASCSFSLLQYEVLHSFHHGALPEAAQRLLERMPALRAMRHRHRVHHCSGQRRSTCYNITWPLGDWLFGTLGAPAPERGEGETQREMKWE